MSQIVNELKRKGKMFVLMVNPLEESTMYEVYLSGHEKISGIEVYLHHFIDAFPNVEDAIMFIKHKESENEDS